MNLFKVIKNSYLKSLNGEKKFWVVVWLWGVLRYVMSFLVGFGALLFITLVPIKSYAITPEEAENNALEYTLKLQGINNPDHKKLWTEMKQLREERDNSNFKGEKNLIKFLIQKYDLDPLKNAKDHSEVMERITG